MNITLILAEKVIISKIPFPVTDVFCRNYQFDTCNVPFVLSLVHYSQPG